MTEAATLEAVSIRKAYPGVMALNGVSLTIRPGEVHALIGKNGAGKSTLVRIFSGATFPTSGSLRLAGQPVELRSPRDALQQGIATVYQELSLVPQLTVGHNILLPCLPTRYGGLSIDWPGVYGKSAEILTELNLDIDPKQPVYTLGIADRQMVEIAKIMSFQPRAVLLDEPTSALATHETRSLFHLVRKLTSSGIAIVYISHRLQELQRIADRVSVLRDGELVGTIPIAAAAAKTISEMMFGTHVQPHPSVAYEVASRIVLQARGISAKSRLQAVDLELHQGEILGIAGLLGSGRTELLRALSGADPVAEGDILVDGVAVKRCTVIRMKHFGVGLTPENRQSEGLVLNRSTRENACLASLRRFATWGVVSRRRQRRAVEDNVRDLHIAVSSVEEPVVNLSGGNQQKVVVAKWLNTRPRVLLMDEPTRGIDIQAKQQIFQVMRDLVRQGISIVFVSSELEELVEVCHRIAIMQEGRIVSTVRADEVTPHKLFEYCVHFEPTGGDRSHA